MNTSNRNSFLWGILFAVASLAVWNGTVSEMGFMGNPNLLWQPYIDAGNRVHWNQSSWDITAGETSIQNVTAANEVSSKWYQLQTVDTDTQNTLIEQSLELGETYLYRIETIDDLSSIYLLIDGIEYPVELADATATIARSTDPLRIAMNGVEYAFQSIELN